CAQTLQTVELFILVSGIQTIQAFGCLALFVQAEYVRHDGLHLVSHLVVLDGRLDSFIRSDRRQELTVLLKKNIELGSLYLRVLAGGIYIDDGFSFRLHRSGLMRSR